MVRLKHNYVIIKVNKNWFVDIRCDDLPMPANGEIISCSSGRVEVGYEGDTCIFKCNTGYELTGSGIRTCQSDGSWSGSDDINNGSYSWNSGDDLCRKGNFTGNLTQVFPVH